MQLLAQWRRDLKLTSSHSVIALHLVEQAAERRHQALKQIQANLAAGLTADGKPKKERKHAA